MSASLTVLRSAHVLVLSSHAASYQQNYHDDDDYDRPNCVHRRTTRHVTTPRRRCVP